MIRRTEKLAELSDHDREVRTTQISRQIQDHLLQTRFISL
jgi:hypothetical protein